MGQEWLALYTVKSKNKGNPILADTILLKYGKENNIPELAFQTSFAALETAGAKIDEDYTMYVAGQDMRTAVL